MKLQPTKRCRGWAGLVLAFGLWVAPQLLWAQVALPRQAGDQHLGVVTCAGSTCHGSIRASDKSSVLQNEFVTWHREDKHAQAYKVLLNDRSKRIAANLGLAAAEKADLCLDCHADNVPESARGKRFQIADGVGCEACHGGAERYLGPHLAADVTHAANLELGLYPTEDPAARARLCLSCHLGTRDTLATHRIMAAGHPRLSFELDTFTDIQPAHFKIDDDYRRRKGDVNAARVWASGQIVAARSFVDLFLAYQAKATGMLPELFFFDCHACHRSLHGQRWRPRASTGLEPGVIRINDAHLTMSRFVAEIISPAQRKRLEQAILALHTASDRDLAASIAAARRLAGLLGELERGLVEAEFGPAQMRSILASVVADGVRGEYLDYANAEQAAMAIGSLIHAMQVAGAIDASRAATLNAALDPVYAALQSDDRYQPADLITAMRALQGRL